MSSRNHRKSSEVAVTFSEMVVMMRRKSHTFDSEKVGRYTITLICLLHLPTTTTHFEMTAKNTITPMETHQQQSTLISNSSIIDEEKLTEILLVILVLSRRILHSSSCSVHDFIKKPPEKQRSKVQIYDYLFY